MSAAKKNFSKDVHQLLNELKEEDLSQLPPDKILELRKKLNPYGRTIKGSDKYLNFSITQIHHEYWRKLIISAVVGFLNRACDEWKVPKSVPVVKVYEYLDDPTKLDTPKNVLERDPKGTAEWEFNRQWMEKRKVVKEFLEEFFQFNPDEHTKSGYIPHRADKSRKPLKSRAAKVAVEHLKRVDPEFRVKEELYEEIQQLQDTVAQSSDLPTGVDVDDEDRPIAKLAVDLIKEANKKIEPFSQTNEWFDSQATAIESSSMNESTDAKEATDTTQQSTTAQQSTVAPEFAPDDNDPEPPLTIMQRTPYTIPSKTGKKKSIVRYKEVERPNPDHAEWLARREKRRLQHAEQFATHDGHEFPLRTSTVYHKDVRQELENTLPPVDTFHRIHNYLTSNYEEIRDFVRDCYCERPELELAINPYSVHDTLEDAEAFKKQHCNEVIAEVFTAHFGKWNFIDCFKEQRESTTFYNDKTILLEEIIRNTEREQRAGMELMQKTVKKEKRKNVLESGPDAANLKKWMAQNNDVQRMGAERVNHQNDPSIGDDQVELNLWRVAKGGQEITKHVLALQAEAPSFVKDAQDAARLAGKLPLSAQQEAQDPIGSQAYTTSTATGQVTGAGIDIGQ